MDQLLKDQNIKKTKTRYFSHKEYTYSAMVMAQMASKSPALLHKLYIVTLYLNLDALNQLLE
jgi:hypothetical protein